MVLTDAIEPFDDTHGLLDAAVPDPVNCEVPPIHAFSVPVIVGRAFTVIVMVFDVAGEPVAQVAFDVITTVTVWPFVNVVVVYVGLLVPTFAPLTFHW